MNSVEKPKQNSEDSTARLKLLASKRVKRDWQMVHRLWSCFPSPSCSSVSDFWSSVHPESGWLQLQHEPNFASVLSCSLRFDAQSNTCSQAGTGPVMRSAAKHAIAYRRTREAMSQEILFGLRSDQRRRKSTMNQISRFVNSFENREISNWARSSRNTHRKY